MSTTSSPALSIPVVLGSIRPSRRSYHPARLLHERALAAGHRSELIDLQELGLPMYGPDEAEAHPSVRAFKAAMDEADAVIWLSPEYNHGYTSAIKNAVDYLHEEIRRKPVAVCGLSGSALGGARAVEQLKLVLIELHSVPIRGSVYFNNAGSIFDPDGHLLRDDLLVRADEVVAELAWYAATLKWGRANLPIPRRRR